MTFLKYLFICMVLLIAMISISYTKLSQNDSNIKNDTNNIQKLKNFNDNSDGLDYLFKDTQNQSKINLLVNEKNAILQPETNFIKNNNDEKLNKTHKTTNHTPKYGKELSRSKSKASIQLVDLLGQNLEPNIVRAVKLWRNYRNNFYIESFAEFNHITSTVECDGFSNKGLEPGNYILEINGGGYGVLKLEFKIAKDEEYKAIYKMPNYQKIIKLIFVDKEGNRQNYIRNIPRYKLNVNKVEFTEQKTKFITILTAQPEKISYSNFSTGCGGFQMPITYGIRKISNGEILLRVFANIQGSITYDIGNYNSPEIIFQISSNFTDIDEYIIQITPIGSHEQNNFLYVEPNKPINTNKISNTEEIFNTSFNSLIPGFSIQAKNANTELSLHYDFSNELLQLDYSGFEILNSHDKNEFYINFKNITDVNKLNYRFSDNKLFLSEWFTLSLNKYSPVYNEHTFNFKPYTLMIESSPTFRAICQNVAILESIGLSSIIELSEDLIQIKSFFANEEIQNQIFKNLKLNIYSMIKINERNHFENTVSEYYPKRYKYEHGNYIYSFNINLSNEQYIQNEDVQINAKIKEKIIILKTINETGNSIPFIECSLIPNKELATALKVKEVLNDNKAYECALTHLKNISNFNFEENINYEEPDKQNLLKIKNAVNEYVKLKEETKNLLKKIFKEDETLEYFLKHGAWYNTSNKSISDEAGFLILQSEDIVPGEQYTLYFWCDSNDELIPDKEITFTASETITDLGLIQF